MPPGARTISSVFVWNDTDSVNGIAGRPPVATRNADNAHMVRTSGNSHRPGLQRRFCDGPASFPRERSRHPREARSSQPRHRSPPTEGDRSARAGRHRGLRESSRLDSPAQRVLQAELREGHARRTRHRSEACRRSQRGQGGVGTGSRQSDPRVSLEGGRIGPAVCPAASGRIRSRGRQAMAPVRRPARSGRHAQRSQLHPQARWQGCGKGTGLDPARRVRADQQRLSLEW